MLGLNARPSFPELIDLPLFPLSNGNDNDSQQIVFYFIYEAESRSAQFNLVMIEMAAQAVSGDVRILKPFGQLLLKLLPQGRIQLAPFFEGTWQECEAIAHPVKPIPL